MTRRRRRRTNTTNAKTYKHYNTDPHLTGGVETNKNTQANKHTKGCQTNTPRRRKDQEKSYIG